MFISDSAFQFVYPSSFSDSVPVGSLGFGALSDGFYVRDSAGVSSRVLLVKDSRNDVRATGSTDSSLVTETGIRSAIQAYKPVPDGTTYGQMPYWTGTAWATSGNILNVGEGSPEAILQLIPATLSGGYKNSELKESPFTRWGFNTELGIDTGIEMVYYDSDNPLNASVNFSIGSTSHSQDYLHVVWVGDSDTVHLYLPTLATAGFLTTDSYGQLAVDSNTYEHTLGNPSSNGQVLASTTTGIRSWVSLPSAGVSVTNQGDTRLVTCSGTTDVLDAESDLLFSGSSAYMTLRGTKTTTLSIQTSVANAVDYAQLSLLRSRGTIASPTSVVDGDIIGILAFQAVTTSYGTSSPVTITAIAEDTFAFAARGGSLKIDTVPEGSITSATRFEITKTGAIKFNGAYTFPTADGSANYILKTNGSGVVSWAADSSNTGTVTSVAMTVPTGLTIGGTPITTSGTLALTFTSGYSIPTTANQTNWGTAYTHSQATTGFHGSTTVGESLVKLANPGAVTFIKISATNVASTESAATYRTSLGSTTVGDSFFTTANPSAITFPQVNANNTVTYQTAANFRTAIGAGTGNGTVTSVTASGALASSGGTTPAITVAATYQIPTSTQVTNWDALVSSQWVTVTNGIQYSSNVGIGIAPDGDKKFKASAALAYVGYFISTYTAGTSYCLSGVSSGANTANTNVGVYASASNGLTNFAFHIDTSTVAGTNNWALRVSSTAKNHLEGTTGIGIADALGKLQVYNGATSALPAFVVNQLNSSYGLADFQASGTSRVSINYTGQIISTVASGTAPMTIASNTVVSNLNADLLDGYHSSSFQTALTNPITGTGTSGKLPKFNSTTSLGDSVFSDNATYGYVSSGLGIGDSAVPNSTVKLALNSATGATALVVKSDYALQTGTGNQTIGQVDLRHISTTTAYSRIVLRYNMDTTHYEHAQIFAAPTISGIQSRNYMVIDGYTGALQIQSGINTYEFKNYGHTGISTDAASFTGIGTISPATKLHVYHSNSTSSVSTVTLENADATTGGVHLDFKTGYTSNAGDYFRFSMRGDQTDVVQTVYDASAATWKQLYQYKYLTGFLYWGSPTTLTTDITNGRMGIGSNSTVPTAELSFGFGANRAINVLRETTAATAGRDLTISAGSAVSGGTNLKGGNIILETGISTGLDTSTSFVVRVPNKGTSGTSDNALFDVLTLSNDGFMALQSNVDYGPQVNLSSYNSTAANASYVNFLRYRGTIGAGTAISAGDTLGSFTWKGYANGAGRAAANLIVTADSIGATYINGKMIIRIKESTNTSNKDFTFDSVGFMSISEATGGINFGADVNLYRQSASVLRTDDSFSIDKDQAFYIGTPNATDSWRFILVSKNLEIQYHNGTSYITKTTIQV